MSHGVVYHHALIAVFLVAVVNEIIVHSRDVASVDGQCSAHYVVVASALDALVGSREAYQRVERLRCVDVEVLQGKDGAGLYRHVVCR